MAFPQSFLSPRFRRVAPLVLAAALAGGAPVRAPARARTCHPIRSAPGPVVDAHVHVLSPGGAARLRTALGADGALEAESRAAGQVLAMLDSAGVRRALVISDAYEFGQRELAGAGEEAAVREENDWVAAQVARAPGRLVGFCSVDPLKGYASREIERCARVLHLSGLKLHFTGAGVDLRDPRHLERLRQVFAAADRLRLPLLVHLRTWRRDFGAEDARRFVRDLLPAAPHVPVQLAHLAGWGGYDAATDAALAVFADELAHGSLRGRSLYFDLAMVAAPVPRAFLRNAGSGSAAEEAARSDAALLRRLRQLGPERVVFGSDWPLGSSLSCASDLRAAFAADPALLRQVLRTVPPYLADSAQR